MRRSQQEGPFYFKKTDRNERLLSAFVGSSPLPLLDNFVLGSEFKLKERVLFITSL
jgi:hypothetical protein